MQDTNVINTPVGRLKFNNYALQQLGFLDVGPTAVINKIVEKFQGKPIAIWYKLIKAGREGYEFEYGDDGDEGDIECEIDKKAIKRWLSNGSTGDYDAIMSAFYEAVKIPEELQRISSNQSANISEGEKKSPKPSTK
jgi:hypothetical protein